MKRAVFVGLGALMIAAGLFWLQENEAESNRAASASVAVLPVIKQQISVSREVAQPVSPEQLEMTEVEADGRYYIGFLEIPVLGLELPVLSEWSDGNGKIAPCRYSGTVYRDDLIICAHNYDSHFGRLKELNIGDEICFVDVEGSRTIYQTTEVEILAGTALAAMESGNWDLTLFTCTAGGKMRFAIRAQRII